MTSSGSLLLRCTEGEVQQSASWKMLWFFEDPLSFKIHVRKLVNGLLNLYGGEWQDGGKSSLLLWFFEGQLSFKIHVRKLVNWLLNLHGGVMFLLYWGR